MIMIMVVMSLVGTWSLSKESSSILFKANLYLLNKDLASHGTAPKIYRRLFNRDQ